MNGAQQRAELFANVDELMAWKKTFEFKQGELIAWQATVMAKLTELEESVANVIKAGNVLIDTDTALGERVDVYNKRVRQLELKTKHLKGEISSHLRAHREAAK